MERRPRLLISACLLGARCRYDGGANATEGIVALMERFEAVPLCPEQLGGLPTPRTPSERLGGRVLTRTGEDVTSAFRRGAEEACRLAALYGARLALLKARSPSCGSGTIYDGSFSGTLVPGWGVTAEALAGMGVRVFDEGHIQELLSEG